jgi:hypothetical protein
MREPAAPTSERRRLIVTLSTIPSRISRIGPVLESIKRQTRKPDGIYVCICSFCEWEKSAYEVPEWLLKDDRVRLIVSLQDYGPASKLLGVLGAETAPETRIVVVDDDWEYGPELLTRLESKFDRHPGCAIGSSGARLPATWSEIAVRIGPEIAADRSPPDRLTFIAESPEDVVVDLLQFGFGTMVLRGWFADDIYDLIRPSEPLFYCDDVLISAYLDSKGIRRICASGIPLPRLLDHSQLRPLSGEGRMARNYRLAIPAISSTLGVWRHVEHGREPPRVSTIEALRSVGARSVRKGLRIVRGAVSRLSRDSKSR